MDGTLLAAWIVALAAVASFIIAVLYRREDVSKAQMKAMIEPIKEDVEQGHQSLLFVKQDMALMQRSIGEVRQQVLDHEASCRERMASIAGMFSEIREDVKCIIKDRR